MYEFIFKSTIDYFSLVVAVTLLWFYPLLVFERIVVEFKVLEVKTTSKTDIFNFYL